MSTLVIQSHREPLPYPWLEECVQSVQGWAQHNHYDYRWLNDELFALVPEALRCKTAGQPVVASDLARLLQLQLALRQGYDTVVWCDADCLIFDPERLTLPASDYAVGREIWVQQSRREWSSTPKVYVKVHNAFMMFRAGNSFLDFYTDVASNLLRQHPGPFVSQFIGPKLLTALHNLITMPVIEQAGMLSPAVVRDIISDENQAGGGRALAAFIDRSEQVPAALNLCASSVEGGDLNNAQMTKVCERLRHHSESLFQPAQA